MSVRDFDLVVVGLAILVHVPEAAMVCLPRVERARWLLWQFQQQMNLLCLPVQLSVI